MKIIDTYLKDLKIIEPLIHGDTRGWFSESYNDKEFKDMGLDFLFIQDNHSFSKEKGTLRGLHYQLEPKAQTKLIRCTQGKIFDVAVDIRKESETYGRWFGIELSSQNKKQLLIPKGFAHGFLTLTENVEVQYKVDELYSYDHERSIRWDDKELSIDWKITHPILSKKDSEAPFFKKSKDNHLKKILITGVNGQLGNDMFEKLSSEGYKIFGTTKSDMDISNIEQVEKTLNLFKPDYIIHCAAYTQVDKAENEQQQCYEVNVIGTSNLLKIAKNLNSEFIYISTDYVFDGSGIEEHCENKNTNPINYYGYTKKLGEEIVRESIGEHYIVRTSWLYGEKNNNFVKTMLNLADKNSSIKVVNDQVGTPTYTKDLAEFISDLILTKKYGTYHGVNNGFCSWAEFAKEIFSVLNIDVDVIPIKSSEYKTEARRPLNSRLGTSKMKNNVGYNLRDWKSALKEYLEKILM
ncbi:dTDP-4-dehydrorhamnose reductase [Exiguobacterium sp. s80]|uniref:dTDP-4-dehydrorhamnose reductase n=1 Tax=Exiguobacterium sp. s80 TaxID=2751209 RepID=UPI001BEAE7DC|nr:dTDP-4-dehydrorhamnose reductase [Exiguobacterium sp. s80]